MPIGVVFPRNEFGGDVGAVGAYAQGVVQLGYPHLLAFAPLVGADPAVHKGRAGPCSADSSPADHRRGLLKPIETFLRRP